MWQDEHIIAQVLNEILTGCTLEEGNNFIPLQRKNHFSEGITRNPYKVHFKFPFTRNQMSAKEHNELGIT